MAAISQVKTGWPDAPESPAGSNRYGWPDVIGITGRITPEYADKWNIRESHRISSQRKVQSQASVLMCRPFDVSLVYFACRIEPLAPVSFLPFDRCQR